MSYLSSMTPDSHTHTHTHSLMHMHTHASLQWRRSQSTED